METPVILFVAHTAEDGYLLRFALLHHHIRWDLRQVEEVQEAIDYLNGASQYGDREMFPFPAATVADINLPDRSGFDLLAWARRQPRLKDHAIVLLRTPGNQVDEQHATQLHATRCFEKTADNHKLIEFLAKVVPRGSRAEAA